MYHPYFRGKQYELITVRETASLLAVADFARLSSQYEVSSVDSRERLMLFAKQKGTPL